jgi:hypothetical protein
MTALQRIEEILDKMNAPEGSKRRRAKLLYWSGGWCSYIGSLKNLLPQLIDETLANAEADLATDEKLKERP